MAAQAEAGHAGPRQRDGGALPWRVVVGGDGEQRAEVGRAGDEVGRGRPLEFPVERDFDGRLGAGSARHEGAQPGRRHQVGQALPVHFSVPSAPPRVPFTQQAAYQDIDPQR